MKKEKPKIKWFGKVTNNNIRLDKRSEFQNHLKYLEGHDIELVIQKRYRSRSLKANAYLWLIYNYISEHTGHSPEEIHEVCKTMFLKGTKQLAGRVYEIVGSTALMDTLEFTQYIEKVKLWAIQELGIQVPDAQEY